LYYNNKTNKILAVHSKVVCSSRLASDYGVDLVYFMFLKSAFIRGVKKTTMDLVCSESGIYSTQGTIVYSEVLTYIHFYMSYTSSQKQEHTAHIIQYNKMSLTFAYSSFDFWIAKFIEGSFVSSLNSSINSLAIC